jgi:hypothetical protein
MLRRISLLLASLLLLSLASVAFAQDLSEEVSESGITVRYPSDWAAQADDDAIVITNDETVIDAVDTSDDIPADAIGISIAQPEIVSALLGDADNAEEGMETFGQFFDYDGEIETGSFENADYARIEAENILNIDALTIVYILDFDGEFVLAAVILGSDFDSEPDIARDILNTLQYTAPERPEAAAGGALAYGDEFTGELTDDANEQVWTFEGSEGDVVTITMISDDFDPLLELYTAAGYEDNDAPLLVNDDAESFELGTDSQIPGFQLPEDGEYVIVATAFSGDGEYEISLEEGGDPVLQGQAAIDAAEAIAYGDEVTGEISDDATRVFYVFEGSEGDVVTITMIAEDNDALDTTLELYSTEDYDANSFALMSNDDALDADIGNYNSQITEFELPEDGEYLIIATRFSGEGEYTLTLEEGSGGK